MTAHPYIGLAYSSAMRLGLHCPSVEAPHLSSEQIQIRQRTLVMILKLDIYSSIVLGLPSFSHQHTACIDFAIPRSNEFSSQLPVASYENDNRTMLELSLKHLELLKIVASGLGVVFPQNAESSVERNGESILSVSIRSLEEIRSQLQCWTKSFSKAIQRMRNARNFEMYVAFYCIACSSHFTSLTVNDVSVSMLRLKLLTTLVKSSYTSRFYII